VDSAVDDLKLEWFSVTWVQASPQAFQVPHHQELEPQNSHFMKQKGGEGGSSLSALSQELHVKLGTPPLPWMGGSPPLLDFPNRTKGDGKRI